MSYRTFIRTAKDWDEFAASRKTIVRRGLTMDEARKACKEYNDARSTTEARKGTKLEFEVEE